MVDEGREYLLKLIAEGGAGARVVPDAGDLQHVDPGAVLSPEARWHAACLYRLTNAAAAVGFDRFVGEGTRPN